MNCELPDVQAGLGKAEKPEIANICWIIEKQESSRKTSTSALLTTPKPLYGSQQTGKFFKRWDTRPPYLPPVKSLRMSRSNS